MSRQELAGCWWRSPQWVRHISHGKAPATPCAWPIFCEKPLASSPSGLKTTRKNNREGQGDTRSSNQGPVPSSLRSAVVFVDGQPWLHMATGRWGRPLRALQSDARQNPAHCIHRPFLWTISEVCWTTKHGTSTARNVNSFCILEGIALNDAHVREGQRRQEMKVRTVVTGHNAKGRAVFVQDEKVDGMPIPGLGELAFLWNANEPATYPNAGNNPAAPGIFPPLGGIRFIIGTYLPGDFIAPEPTPEMRLEDGDELGGANAGFHRTDTTDFGVVLSGNLALQLDDGAEVSLSPGDVLIENGTRHRWRVVGNVPATLASFIIGAQRR